MQESRSIEGWHSAPELPDAVRAFRLVQVVQLGLRRASDELLREAGLTTQQAALLTVVGVSARPTLGEVARALATSHQNAKQIALALERKGLLRIEADPSDGRVRRLGVTPKNERLWARRDRADFAEVERWFSALSPAELARLVELLAKLARDLG